MNLENDSTLGPTDQISGENDTPTVSKDRNGSQSKTKAKKTMKNGSKMKKEEIADKTYILDLENQISVLTSTLNLYKKSASKRECQSSGHEKQTQTQSDISTGCDHNGRHCRYDDLKDDTGKQIANP